MDISTGTVVASFVFPIFLGGVILSLIRSTVKTMNNSLIDMIKEVKVDLTKDIEDTVFNTTKCERVIHKRLDKVDEGLNAKMSKGGCTRTQLRIDSEFKHVKELVHTQTTQNSKDHDALMKSLCVMDKKQDASNEGMAEIITCLALLSENIPCTPTKKKGRKEK